MSKVKVVYVDNLKTDCKVVASSFYVDRNGKWNRAKKKEDLRRRIEEER